MKTESQKSKIKSKTGSMENVGQHAEVMEGHQDQIICSVFTEMFYFIEY